MPPEDSAKAYPQRKIMRKATLAILSVFLAVVAGLATTEARAQNFPSRPIELVVPLAPGSTTDVAARLFAQRVGQTLGAQIVIENKPGAGSMLGSTAVAKAAP